MHSFRRIKLRNFLSFGPDSLPIEFGPVNILIGPNGSGKSNLIEAFALLQSAPESFGRYISRYGDYESYVYSPSGDGETAYIVLRVGSPSPANQNCLEHALSFRADKGGFRLTHERVGNTYVEDNHEVYEGHYSYAEGHDPTIGDPGDLEAPSVTEAELDRSRSALNLFRDPRNNPELFRISNLYNSIFILRDLGFGRSLAARGAQRADLPDNKLEADGSNLFQVLFRLRETAAIRQQLLEAIRNIYTGIEDLRFTLSSGYLDLSFQEKSGAQIQSSRLSDGTLRYLCLLAVLLDPHPPKLIIIDEPETGLHPDLLRNLGELILEAGSRTQLIVATHSDRILDAFGDHPEAVLVFDRGENGTAVNRFDKAQLAAWLQDYTLGQVWSMGYLGGNRW